METSVNNKCRAFTSLEQSRKLAKILPLESADMYYILMPDGVYNQFPLTGRKTELAEKTDIPCWSLASLLDVLPDCILQINTDGTVFVVCESKKLIIDTCDNPVDTCVAMIEKLHELKML